MNEFLALFNDSNVQVAGWKFYLDNLILFLVILVLSPIVLFLINRFILKPFFKNRAVDEGRSFAITSLFKYFFYLFMFVIAIQTLGIKMSVLWTSMAALLVGVGLGLQQTFNDFASGVILLIGGTVEKGDWIEIGSMEGRVDSIGLRTSIIRTRDLVAIIVPNSKITVDNVINLSHNNNKLLRRKVRIGVAYGSDVSLVKNLLLDCANRHQLVAKSPKPAVLFQDFGDSALVFDLFFWSKEKQKLEEVRSDLRFLMDSTFRKHNISIPFPQRDVHLFKHEQAASESLVLEDQTLD